LKLKAVAFDMDGTLYSSEPLIAEVYAQSVKIVNQKYQLDLNSPTFAQIEPLIGQPVKAIYDKLFPGISLKLMDELGKLIMDNFKSAIASQGGTLFPAVKKLFQDLAKLNLKLFIASNGKREYINAILQKFSLVTESFVCINDTPDLIEKADLLSYYLELHQIQNSELIMVGDRYSDLEAARKNKCVFIGCNFGHGNKEEIKTADFIIHDLSEVLDIIKKF
jgi:phosphoglycolate phosphatase